MYRDAHNKFVAVLNRKIPLPQLLNALAHCSSGLGQSLDKSQAEMLEYLDASNEIHPGISRFPWIVLQARNSNQLRDLRTKARNAGLSVTDFTNTMLGESAEAQLKSTKATAEQALDYFVVCIFGSATEVDPLTRKFSLFRGPDSVPEDAVGVAWA
jgi:hypothetical protein